MAMIDTDYALPLASNPFCFTMTTKADVWAFLREIDPECQLYLVSAEIVDQTA